MASADVRLAEVSSAMGLAKVTVDESGGLVFIDVSEGVRHAQIALARDTFAAFMRRLNAAAARRWRYIDVPDAGSPSAA